jgi:hypothetical protein
VVARERGTGRVGRVREGGGCQGTAATGNLRKKCQSLDRGACYVFLGCFKTISDCRSTLKFTQIRQASRSTRNGLYVQVGRKWPFGSQRSASCRRTMYAISFAVCTCLESTGTHRVERLELMVPDVIGQLGEAREHMGAASRLGVGVRHVCSRCELHGHGGARCWRRELLL